MYTLLTCFVSLALSIIALWNRKIRLFVDGRKNVLGRIKEAVSGYDDIIWFHTASMGEFEEARPVIEAVRKRCPDRKILLTFFSPSGYEARKDWKIADWVFYLPLDTYFNARRFVRTVRPAKAVFTIGEFWFNYLGQLKKAGVDTYIMSVYVSKDSPYTKWYGGIYRRLLKSVYKCIMVKNEETRDVLERIGCRNVSVTGDARFDRVAAVASEEWKDDIVEAWSCGRKAAIAGSTCENDDDLFLSLARDYPDDKFMFVPHDLDEAPIRHILDSAPNGAVLYSDMEYVFASRIPENVGKGVSGALQSAQILVIDKIGMLSRLYRYGWCALIGGGFINIPHSVIEAVIYGMPVCMGPQYHKNSQFVDLMGCGVATPVSDTEDIRKWYSSFRDNPELLAKTVEYEADYCSRNTGATERIMGIILG